MRHAFTIDTATLPAGPVWPVDAGGRPCLLREIPQRDGSLWCLRILPLGADADCVYMATCAQVIPLPEEVVRASGGDPAEEGTTHRIIGEAIVPTLAEAIMRIEDFLAHAEVPDDVRVGLGPHPFRIPAHRR